MNAIWQDVRYGLRMLAKSPGFTLVAALTLTLGIGANATVFSMINGFLLRPLPGRGDNARLMALGVRRAGLNGVGSISLPDYRDYRAQSTGVFEDMAAYVNGIAVLSADHRAERSVVHYVTGNFFSMLGMHPAAGRFFLPTEGEQAGADPLLVLGYGYWQRRFQGDRAVIGSSVDVNGKPYTIVGVAPKEFIGPYTPLETDAYVPLGMAMRVEEYPGLETERSAHLLHALARPLPGVGLAQARSALAVIDQRLAREYPVTNKGAAVEVFTERLARPEPSAASATPLIAGVFLALVGLVLLVTCVNVTNLLLVRASGRFKEMAIRASLGAGRTRIFRQLLTESLLLSLLGGAGGALLGWWLSRALSGMRFPGGLPLHMNLTMDWRVFGYIAAIALTCGILAGLAPAWRASRMDLNASLREGGWGGGAAGAHHRMRNALVMAQVGCALAVLVAAGLFVRSLQRAQTMDLGFRAAGLMNAAMDPHQQGYDENRVAAFYRALKERVRALPGVESASFAIGVPMGYYGVSGRVWKEGQASVPEDQLLFVGHNLADEDYLGTLEIPVLRGRGITAQDQSGNTRVAVINETLARRLWPNEDAIGHHFSFTKADGPYVEVVGVVKDGKYDLLFEDQRPYFYAPLAQNYQSMHVLQVRTTLAPASLGPAIENAVHQIDPNLAVFDVQTMEYSLGGGNGFFLLRAGAVCAAALGALGLLLAMVGVYGVASYSASLRVHEIGIRMALGAQRGHILRLVVGQGLLLVSAGLLIGLGLSAGLTHALKSLLFGVSALDPVIFALVPLALLGVAVIACYLPARRATQVDPLTALRCQ